jgi:hypothetical protein
VSAWRFLSLLGPTKTKKVKAINHFFTIQNLSCHRFSGRWKMTFSSILKTKISYLVISIFFVLSIFAKLYWATFFWGFLLLLNLYFTYRTKKSILSNHDELVGEWNTDDGTGFYFAVMGYYLKFSNEGNGIYAYWSSDKEFDKEQEIEWQRIG